MKKKSKNTVGEFNKTHWTPMEVALAAYGRADYKYKNSNIAAVLGRTLSGVRNMGWKMNRFNKGLLDRTDGSFHAISKGIYIFESAMEGKDQYGQLIPLWEARLERATGNSQARWRGEDKPVVTYNEKEMPPSEEMVKEVEEELGINHAEESEPKPTTEPTTTTIMPTDLRDFSRITIEGPIGFVESALKKLGS